MNGDEETRLLKASDESKAEALSLCVVTAIETGMRAGEIVGLEWEQIDLSARIIRLDIAKNGDRRVVPLTEIAEGEIRARQRPTHGGKLTSFYDSRGLSAAFRPACERAGIVDLHFHALRHEAASRLAPRMPVPTLQR